MSLGGGWPSGMALREERMGLAKQAGRPSSPPGPGPPAPVGGGASAVA